MVAWISMKKCLPSQRPALRWECGKCLQWSCRTYPPDCRSWQRQPPGLSSSGGTSRCPACCDPLQWAWFCHHLCPTSWSALGCAPRAARKCHLSSPSGWGCHLACPIPPRTQPRGCLWVSRKDEEYGTWMRWERKMEWAFTVQVCRSRIADLLQQGELAYRLTVLEKEFQQEFCMRPSTDPCLHHSQKSCPCSLSSYQEQRCHLHLARQSISSMVEKIVTLRIATKTKMDVWCFRISGVPICGSTYLIPSGWHVILGRFPLNFAHTFFRIDLLILTIQCSLFETKDRGVQALPHDRIVLPRKRVSFQQGIEIALPYGPSHWLVNPTSQCWDLGLGTPECHPLLQQVPHHCPAEGRGNCKFRADGSGLLHQPNITTILPVMIWTIYACLSKKISISSSIRPLQQ